MSTKNKSKNVFAQFAATSNASSKLAKSEPSSDGWIATKRRGRDDGKIAQDRGRALQARRTTKTNISKKSTSTNSTRKSVVVPPKKKTKRKNTWSDDDDDDDEINSFVVDDDEELEEDWNSDDDEVADDVEEDLVIAEPRRRATKVNNSNKKQKDQKSKRNDNASDYDEFIDTPPADRKANRKSTPITIDSEDDEEAEFVDEDSEEEEEDVVLLDDSDESDVEITPVKSKFFANKKNTMDDDSSDSDDDEVGNARSRNDADRNNLLHQKKKKKQEPSVDKTSKNTKRLKKKKKNQNVAISLEDSDDEGLFSPLDKTKPVTSVLVSSTESNGSSTALFKDDDDEETTPLPNIKRKTAKSNDDADKAALLENDDKTRVAPQKKRKQQIEDDDAGDDNEQLAVALALSASQAEFDSSPAAKQYRDDSEEEAPPEDEEDDEDDASHVNETQDERRDAASRVLDSANKLSQQVLQNMMAWSSEGGASASQGMIVDGALALTNCDEPADDTKRKAWISQAKMKEICPKVVLADYQLIGVNWLALLHEMRVDVGDKEKTNVNGILAVMGLGKTVQTIAFLAWLHAKNGSEKDADGKDEVVDICDSDDEVDTSTKTKNKPVHVVVVPASVLDNWMDEFEKFAPQLSVVKYHGPMAQRNEMRFDLERRLPRKKNPKKVKCDIDVVLTTFSYFSGNKSDDRKFLRRFDFEYMVIDEAHCLKNPDSNAYQNLDRFDTAHRLLLTGTPVQNSPKELMSLICFLMPLFKNAGSAGWDDDENKNDGGARMLEHFVSLEGGAGDAMSDEAAYRKLKQLFAPFVLRRGKDVLSQTMPKKTREVLRVPLNPKIRKLYNEILATHLKNKGNKKAIGGNQAARQHLFTTLRKVANHPLLLRNRYSSDSDVDHLASHLRMYGYFGHDDACTLGLVKKELEKFSDFDIHLAALDVIDENPIRRDVMSRYVLAEEDMFCSPKLEKLRTLIPDLVNNGHRLLIFSQWTNCLDLLGCLMESLKYKFFRLDGQTAISTRQAMINDFNNDPTVPVFLLSTKAGGMGINLTAADVCILHDLDFNPFNDLQAEDRCHRIGQTKPVRVIKMVTTETVDDDIYSMQQRKTSMNAAILEKGGSSLDSAAEKKKDQEEIKSMLQNQLDRYLSSETTKSNSGGMIQFLKKK